MLQRKSKHTFYVQYYISENRAFYEIMIVAYAHCMQDTEGYERTPKICNNYCVFTATMVTDRV